MLNYTLRRLLQAIPVIIGVSLITFIHLTMVPGAPEQRLLAQRANPDAVAELRQNMGLNEPLHRQYLTMMGNIMTGDLGRSLITRENVIDEFRARFPVTLRLALLATAMAAVIGIAVGILSAIYQNSVIDRIAMFLTLLGISVPVFWYALIMILLVIFQLRWVPQTGLGDGSLKFYILPAFVLGTRAAALDRKSTRLNSSHVAISYAVFCLKKKKTT